MLKPILHGVPRPTGEGLIVEVHIDAIAKADAMEWCKEYGFEDDPFSIFHPSQYTHHMTGRARVSQKQLGAFLMKIEALTTSVIVEAQLRGIALYTEVEIVRESRSFRPQERTFVPVLDKLSIFPTFGKPCGADVHIEWETGTVSQEVNEYLKRSGFYWVRTPKTSHFPSEQIATLQAATFRGAKDVFDRIAANPFPWMTGMHLEQKPPRIGMRGTTINMPMPDVMDVCWRG